MEHNATNMRLRRPPGTLLAERLNRRARHGSVGAEHAAITRSWPKYDVAILTLVKLLARLRRHRVGFDVTARRTKECRFENDSAHGVAVQGRWTAGRRTE